MPQPKNSGLRQIKRYVLIVEDDPIISTLFRDYLLMRFDVEVFRSFRAFRTAAPVMKKRSDSFLCAVLDYHLPDGNASDMIPLLAIPVIVVTGDTKIKKVPGAEFVLHKPAVLGDLFDCLEKLEAARYKKETGYERDAIENL